MTDQSTVSVNMTWTGNLNLLVACRTCGNDEARTTAREELRRMAAQADKYVASQELLQKGRADVFAHRIHKGVAQIVQLQHAL